MTHHDNVIFNNDDLYAYSNTELSISMVGWFPDISVVDRSIHTSLYIVVDLTTFKIKTKMNHYLLTELCIKSLKYDFSEHMVSTIEPH